MNLCFLIGRTTREPEIRYSQGETPTAIASFSLAVSRRFQNDKTDFINCVAFGKTAEFCQKYIGKGVKIAVRGSIQIDSYTDKDGVKRYLTKVIVDEVEFAQNKTEDVQKGEKAAADGFINIPDGIDSELPFK